MLPPNLPFLFAHHLHPFLFIRAYVYFIYKSISNTKSLKKLHCQKPNSKSVITRHNIRAHYSSFRKLCNLYKKKKKIIQFSNLEVTRNKIFQIWICEKQQSTCYMETSQWSENRGWQCEGNKMIIFLKNDFISLLF